MSRIVKFLSKDKVQIIDYGQSPESLKDDILWAIKNMFLVEVVKKPKTIDIWRVKKMSESMKISNFIKE